MDSNPKKSLRIVLGVFLFAVAGFLRAEIQPKNGERKLIEALEKGCSGSIHLKKVNPEIIICCDKPVTFDKPIHFENLVTDQTICFQQCVFKNSIGFNKFQGKNIVFDTCHFLNENLEDSGNPVAAIFSNSTFEDLSFFGNVFEVPAGNPPKSFSITLSNVTANGFYNCFFPVKYLSSDSNSGSYGFSLESSKVNDVYLVGKPAFLHLFDLESQKLSFDGLALQSLILSGGHVRKFRVGVVDWPAECVIDRFTYDSISDSNTDYQQWSALRDEKTTPQHPFLMALDRSRFTPEGYFLYEKAVRDGGDLMAADNVFYHLQKRLWTDAFITNWPLVTPLYRFLKWVLFWLTGYFKTTFCLIPLGWTILTVGLGCWVFRGKNMVERVKTDLKYSAFWYTLDLFLPGFNLHAEENWFPKTLGQLFYLRFVKLFGRFLFGVLVGVWLGVFK